MACDGGASTIAFTTGGNESTSPNPVIPASVSMRISRASWLPSALETSISGWRRMMAWTSVIFNPFFLHCSAPAQARIQDVPQAVPQKVEPQDDDHDGQTRKNGHPRRNLHVGARQVQHSS